MDRWSFVNSDHPASAYLTDLFPQLALRSISLTLDVQHPFELPYGERMTIAAIATLLEPAMIFEFGTYSGSTTTMLADASPRAVVHTLDLPADEIVWGEDVIKALGKNFRGRPEYAGRIVSHRCNSRLFDFSPFENKIDLVFIDGSHEYSDVLEDSANALRMLTPHGVIIWDDYQPLCMDVAKAIQHLAGTLPIVRIAQTRLSIMHRS
jgi:tRNA A58 N-methylase Trm61